MYLYRVCFPPRVPTAWEDIPLPGGENKFTGFWTPHASCARAIYLERARYAELTFGGGTYAKIWRVRVADVEIATATPAAKSGHAERFDKDEVLVVRLRSEPEDVTSEIIKK